MRGCLFYGFFLAVCIALVPGVFAETVFTDDFSGGLANWTPGTKEGKNDYHNVIVNAEEEVEFIRKYDYIQTSFAFGDSFEISFDVRRTTSSSSSGQFDFLVEVVEVPEYSGVVQLVYGISNTYKVNMGQAPTISGTGGNGVDIDDTTTGCYTSMQANGSPYGLGFNVGQPTPSFRAERAETRNPCDDRGF